jgi:hypothetical protein
MVLALHTSSPESESLVHACNTWMPLPCVQRELDWVLPTFRLRPSGVQRVSQCSGRSPREAPVAESARLTCRQQSQAVSGSEKVEGRDGTLRVCSRLWSLCRRIASQTLQVHEGEPGAGGDEGGALERETFSLPPEQLRSHLLVDMEHIPVAILVRLGLARPSFPQARQPLAAPRIALYAHMHGLASPRLTSAWQSFLPMLGHALGEGREVHLVVGKHCIRVPWNYVFALLFRHSHVGVRRLSFLLPASLHRALVWAALLGIKPAEAPPELSCRA